MFKFYIPGEQLAPVLKQLGPKASGVEIAEAVERVVVERRLEMERGEADAIAELSAKVEDVSLEIDRDRRERIKPEVDRYLGMRLTNLGGW